jgi:hypothetical protein
MQENEGSNTVKYLPLDQVKKGGNDSEWVNGNV